MEPIGQQIRRRRNALGMTLQQLADRAGCAKAYLSMIETGQRPVPGEQRLSVIEQALGLESGQLVRAARWASTPLEVRQEVEALRTRQRSAAAVARHLLDAGTNLDSLLQNGELHRIVENHAANVDSPMPLRFQVPIINSVAAGYPQHFTDLDYPARVAQEYLSCPDVADPQAFAARVVGDSMEPQYRKGDLVVFSPDRPTPNGTDCFVRLEPNSDTTFKRVFFEGPDGATIRLKPLNSRYPDRWVDREQIGGIYAAVYVMRRVESG